MAAYRHPDRVQPKSLPAPSAIDRVPPPHNLDAEHAFLAAIMLEWSERVLDFAYLRSPEFFSEKHRRLWEVIVELAQKNEPVTFITVGHLLKARGWNSLFADNDLFDYCHTTEVVSQPHAYAKRIQLQAKLRELAAVVQRVNARVYVDNADPNDIFAEAERLVTECVRSGPGMGDHRLGADKLFDEPLPDEPAWVVKDLLIAPGRVALAAGSPDSGKTLSWQSLGISVASGAKAWEHFDVQRRGLVVHLNWDQELEATKRRYRRLLRGRNLDVDTVRGYLEVIDDPSFSLDTDVGIAELRAICRGATLVIVDALTGALSDVDEKDPIIGRWLRKMGKISEQTGCVIVVIHHSVKPPQTKSRGAVDRDAVFDVRGSTAIAGASGAQFSHLPIKKGELYSVRMGRPPTNAKRALEPFALRFLDVKREEASEDLYGERREARPDGVRVAYVAPDEIAELVKTDRKKSDDGGAAFEQFAQRVLELIKREPGLSGATIKERLGKCSKDRVYAALDHLDRKKLAASEKGAKRAELWRAT